MIEEITGFAFQILAGALIAFFTVRFSLRKFRSERLWERKVLAYERIIQALHVYKMCSEVELRAAQQGRGLSEKKKIK